VSAVDGSANPAATSITVHRDSVAPSILSVSPADGSVVGLPDVKNADRAIRQVGTTAQLLFYDFERNVIGDPRRPINGLLQAVQQAAKAR